ncbi:hypothetical protein PPL_04907 [Heterostelium album PN500]|uniref:Uncharacterized protein n=1 Tax=Heterostelium pallidum (strain ATCC 26659 / Pp 5 / PN500) TaxID=670386 RepID=D3B8W4_HETP5|nr:hypothetical protein PPL_04907 [Heterostelium album PN500]EFA82482.1 hypothetical protein PPL_04907 [Heterostelium album PN500]|eukprot:XP_020434599.1 hypothetical protein PPL_04907 [Heterostelium album PN500]
MLSLSKSLSFISNRSYLKNINIYKSISYTSSIGISNSRNYSSSNSNNNNNIEEDLEFAKNQWNLEKNKKKQNLHLNKVLKDLKNNDSEINQLIGNNSGSFNDDMETGRPKKKMTNTNKLQQQQQQREKIEFKRVDNSDMMESLEVDRVPRGNRPQQFAGSSEQERRDTKDPAYYREIAPGIAVNPSLSKINKQQTVVSSTTGDSEVENAKRLATELGLDYLPLNQVESLPEQFFGYQLVLCVTPSATTLNDTEMFEAKSGKIKRKLKCEVSVDFTAGQLQFKTEHKTYAKSPMIRALRLSGGSMPKTVLDVTGGLGKDSWIIASFGSAVTMVERNPILHYLVSQALEKAKLDENTREIAERITLVKSDSIEYLVSVINREPELQPDAIYMDPMYQSREDDEKAALSKKDIRAIRKLVGGDRESKLLFALSKRIAQQRIVWKKPKRVLPVVGIDTSYRSRDTRFDVYLTSTKKLNFSKPPPTQEKDDQSLDHQ